MKYSFESTPVSAREKQLRLGVLWKQREITGDKLKSRGVTLDAQDIERYTVARETHRAMKGREESGWSEWLLLEGADESGMSKSSKQAYRWFGDEVVAYPPHKYDDVLRGVDAILMFADPDDDRKAFPITVDVTTNIEEYQTKFARDFTRLSSQKTTPPRIYWVDAKTETPGLYLDQPQEGRVAAVNVSIYIPTEQISQFIDEKNTAAQADTVMYKLGPFVLQQFATALETQALFLLGQIKMEKVESGATSLPELSNREDLLEQMENPPSTLTETQLNYLRILRGVIPTVWRSLSEQQSIDRGLRKELPDIIKTLDVLKETGNKAA